MTMQPYFNAERIAAATTAMADALRPNIRLRLCHIGASAMIVLGFPRASRNGRARDLDILTFREYAPFIKAACADMPRQENAPLELYDTGINKVLNATRILHDDNEGFLFTRHHTEKAENGAQIRVDVATPLFLLTSKVVRHCYARTPTVFSAAQGYPIDNPHDRRDIQELCETMRLRSPEEIIEAIKPSLPYMSYKKLRGDPIIPYTVRPRLQSVFSLA